MTEVIDPIRVQVECRDQMSFLTVSGVLDGVTYRTLRNAVIKAALDEPRAVIVDVDELSVPFQSAWSVFTSARWHVSTWPDVPILLVCAQLPVQRSIAASGVARYVPVLSSRESAVDAIDSRSWHNRRRARIELQVTRGSIGIARAVIAEWLTRWDKRELIPVASTVATAFVENVLEHTDSAPVLIVESYRDTVTVAVEDCSDRQPGRREDPDRGADVVSGLAIVSALSRVWRSTPTSSGKTVWALVGPENEL